MPKFRNIVRNSGLIFINDNYLARVIDTIDNKIYGLKNDNLYTV